MKRLFTGIGIIVALLSGFWACEDADKTLYEGPEYIQFSDTLSYYPVQNSQDWFEVKIASTVACDYDRTFAVEVDDSKSNAVENRHYVIESNTVTIKAGERTTNFRIRGLYENIGNIDSLSVMLNLVSDVKTQWPLYGSRTRIEMNKSCPFDLNVFTGYCILTSTWYNAYMSTTKMRLLECTADPEAENTIVMHDFFYKGYDIRLKFDTKNPLEPALKMDDQMVGSTAEAFGTIYGNGKLMMRQPSQYISYYNVCQHFGIQYVTMYVDGVGTVGTYVNIIEWISDEEAQKLKNEGY